MMKKGITLVIVAGILGMLLISPAWATSLYTNGSMDSTSVEGGSPIQGYWVSNSFTLSETSTVTSIEVGLWVYNWYEWDPRNTIVGFDWSIGSSANTATEASGTATTLTNLTNTLYLQVPEFDIYKSAFSLNETMGPGTYWLTLQNAEQTRNISQPVAWVSINNGISRQNVNGNLMTESTYSNYFQVYGNTSSVPEPTSILLLGLGLFGLAGIRRKFKK